MAQRFYSTEESRAERINNLTLGYTEETQDRGDVIVRYRPVSTKELVRILNTLTRRTYMIHFNPQLMVTDTTYYDGYDTVEISRDSLVRQIKRHNLFDGLDRERKDGQQTWLNVVDRGSIVFIG